MVRVIVKGGCFLLSFGIYLILMLGLQTVSFTSKINIRVGGNSSAIIVHKLVLEVGTVSGTYLELILELERVLRLELGLGTVLPLFLSLVPVYC